MIGIMKLPGVLEGHYNLTLIARKGFHPIRSRGKTLGNHMST